jgi:hypothetical protein
MKTESQNLLQVDLSEFQKKIFWIGVASALLSILLGTFNLTDFFRSYLLGYLFWLGISLGSLAVLMLHHLAGGEWSFVIRRPLEAATKTLPMMALLFLPIILGLKHLYPWMNKTMMQMDIVLQKKVFYLNDVFFISRFFLYFGLWIIFSHFLNKWSDIQDRREDRELTYRLKQLSGPGLVMFGFTTTFAAIDWVMSLDPHWFSTMFGALFFVGQVLTTLSFMIVLMIFLSRRSPVAEYIRPKHFHDLGNILLAFVMLWTYMSFSQFLIIWSGNLPEEIPWYLHRSTSLGKTIAIILTVVHFAIPFALLLSRSVKRSSLMLGFVAAGILIMRPIDLAWNMGPTSSHSNDYFRWTDFILLVAIGAIWGFCFISYLKKRPFLVHFDERLQKEFVHA